MPEKNKSSLLLTLGAAGLLIGGGVTAYWLLTQQSRTLGDLPVGAGIIPQDALLTISVSTESAKWQQLREFGTQQTQAELNQNLVRLRDRFLTNNGYKYERDIQPWVGKEVAIAFLSPQTNTPTTNSTPNLPAKATNKQQPIVMVLPIANQAAAQEILEKPQPNQQGKWVERNYKGVEIREKGTPTQNFSAAVLNQRFLVVSDHPQATERAIDAYQGGTSIDKIPGFTEELGKIKEQNRFAQLYVNVPAAARVATANPAQPIPQGLVKLQQHQGIATTVTLEPEGMRFKSVSWLQPNSQRLYTVENNAGRMQSRLPSETLMMLSGGNLQRLWQDYVQGVQSNPLAPVRPDELRGGVKSLTGLDLDQDLLSWMDREFSLSVVPAAPKANTPPDFALSLVLMVQTSDRSRAEKSLQQLDQVISNQFKFQVQQAQVGGQPVINWIAPYGPTLATHGWLNDNVAFFSLGAPVADRIIPQPATTLANTEQFQATVPSQPSPHNSQFFLNVEPTVKVLPLPQIFSGQQTFLEAMRSIGVTASVNDQRSIRYDIFVSLKKVDKPQPLPSPAGQD